MKTYLKEFLTIERLAFGYCCLTLLLMAVLWPRLIRPADMLAMRGMWAFMTVGLMAASHFIIKRWEVMRPWTTVVRITAQMVWLKQWYPDTYEFNICFDNLDHLFASWEAMLFGCQPSLEFSRSLPQAFWSEAFNLGYISYFPMIAVLNYTIFFKAFFSTSGRQRIKDTTYQPLYSSSYIITLSFFIYYLIYMFVPVVGPQYYFCAVGVDQIEQGNFPVLGNYFTSHMDMLPKPGWTDGLFHNLVASAQAAGERPTAAFPSSHIGVTTIMVLLAYRYARKLLWLFIPLWVLLCCATVYIQAHYLVDAIAGLITAPIVYWLAKRACPVPF
ncbi:MAG: phosphatase PAP2 family protein [Bacteroidaceae bacterium]|nr:phosphatase PAP2 family protein [Bacteroidaceae bacterium]